MKKTNAFTIKKTTGLLLICTPLLLFPVTIAAQSDSSKKTGAAATQPESAPELISPSLTFSCVQKGDNTVDLNAALKTKMKGSVIKLPFLKIKFILVNAGGEKELGFGITNGEGRIRFTVKDSLTPDAEGKLHFKASFAGNKGMEAATEEVTVKRAKLSITAVKEDSVLTVKVKLVETGTGVDVPVKETELGVFVKRSFLPMKIGTATTDESGEAAVEVSSKLPGDAKGNITLLAKLDENEVYGNLEASTVQQWGVPVSDVINEQPRALWSPHPPIWMLVTFIVLMTAVWGHFFVIIYQLWRLRKEEPHDTVHAGS